MKLRMGGVCIIILIQFPNVLVQVINITEAERFVHLLRETIQNIQLIDKPIFPFRYLLQKRARFKDIIAELIDLFDDLATVKFIGIVRLLGIHANIFDKIRKIHMAIAVHGNVFPENVVQLF